MEIELGSKVRIKTVAQLAVCKRSGLAKYIEALKAEVARIENNLKVWQEALCCSWEERKNVGYMNDAELLKTIEYFESERRRFQSALTSASTCLNSRILKGAA